MRPRLAITAALLAVSAACTGPPPRPSPSQAPTPAPATPSPSPSPSLDLGSLDIRLRQVISDVALPLYVTHAGDGSGRLYVVQQVGVITVFRGDDRDTFLDIGERLTWGGEQGLLGLAFHPQDPSRFFVNYTDREGDTVVSEFRAESPTRTDRGSERILLRIRQPFDNHNGGALAFGPDGYLYVAAGDGGSGGDPQGNGQRTDTLLGKILRLDVDRGAPYSIPPDNPFADGGGRPEIWAYGLRNPWRITFDRETGDLWIGDVGQNSVEEIDVLGPDRGGANLGWNLLEGRECYTQGACDTGGLVPPVAQYPTAKGCAVTGGYVYRGHRHPAMRGAYLFADYCGGQVWGLDAAGAVRAGRARHRLLKRTGLSVSSFGEDEDGELYLTDLAGGAVYRIEAA
ncbi:MAG TPA: PQQ-dependent sugar dehydrogenase [Actinomycetota bacterium]